MADTSSTTTFRADISSLRAEMQAASRAIKLANSEFKAATAGMDDWGSSADGLEKKIKQLNDVLKAQNKQVELAGEELAKVEKEYGENSAEADRARIKYNNFKAAASQTEKELNQYEDELEQVGEETEEVAEATEDASEGFTVMKGVLADLAATAVKAGIKALGNLAKETFQVGADFEQSMSKVKAISGASADEMQALSDKAKEMGSSTVFSASESAEAFQYMAMAGWDTEEMLSGIEGVMNLAAASGADLATTSDIVTDALTAMGYEAKDAGRLADVMAAAAANSNTSVEQMGATFQYAAPLVGALGYNMEDTAVAIGMMANAGIKGEKAGTALRSILTRLSTGTGDCADAMKELGISMTKTNADGSTSMKSLDEVIGDLRTAFSGLDETQKAQYASSIAGQEAMSGLLAIVGGSEEDFQKLTAAVAGSEGAAKQMADTMNDNVAGSLTLLKSNIEGKMIGVFEKAAPSIKTAIDNISATLDTVDWDSVGEAVGVIAENIGEFITWVINNGDTVKGILEAVGFALGTIFVVDKASNFVTALGNVGTAFTNLGKDSDTAKESASLLSKLITSPAAWSVAAIAGIGIALNELEKAYQNQIKAEHDFTEAQKETIKKCEELSQTYTDLDQARQDSFSVISSEYGHIEELMTEYDSLIDENGEVKKGYEDRANFIINELAQALGVEKEQIQQSIEDNGHLSDSIYEVLKAKEAEAILAADQEAYTTAIKNRTDAFNAYNDALEIERQKYSELEQAEYDLSEAQKKLDEASEKYPDHLTQANLAVEDAAKSMEAAQAAYDEASEAVENAKTAYEGFNATIENHEGLQSAVISGDADKIADALLRVKNDFKTAETATRESLEGQVKQLQKNYDDMKDAVEKGAPGVTQAMVDDAEKMRDLAIAELQKILPETNKTNDLVIAGYKAKKSAAQKAGGEFMGSLVKGVTSKLGQMADSGIQAAKKYLLSIDSKKGEAKKEGSLLAKSTVTGADVELIGFRTSGTKAGAEYVSGVDDKKDDAEKSGKGLASSTKNGADLGLVGLWSSGTNAGGQFNSGVNSQKPAAKTAGSGLASESKSGAESISTNSSGVNFAQGFINGIKSMLQAAFDWAKSLAKKAWEGLKQGQAEGSPSKLTFKSGQYFTEGYINGIVSMQKDLVKTVKGMVTTVVKELTKLSAYDFDVVGENASEIFTNTFSKKTNYMIARMTYENEQRQKEYERKITDLQDQRERAIDLINEKGDKRIADLEKKRDAALTDERKAFFEDRINIEKSYIEGQVKSTESYYDDLIAKQEKYADAYATASSEMLTEYQQAMSEYQAAAQNLIDNTINGITTKYNEMYDTLLGKQDDLVSKLKSAGDLFTISGAGVMYIDDIQEQTRQIKDYTSKLQKIKNKVSAELFDEIASFDMKEGSAYIDRLLEMSAKDLDAYNKAYTEKMEAATTAGELIYRSDIQNVTTQYNKELQTAFAGLPKQLEELGNQAMQGFITGLISNTDYMEVQIRSFINDMVKEFKSLLKIQSPSKVMFGIGEYTGEGFVDGITSLIKAAKKAAAEFAEAVGNPLDSISSDFDNLRGIYPSDEMRSAGGVVNNYNLVQNNTSPKPLTALETYQARRRQIALVKAFA